MLGFIEAPSTLGARIRYVRVFWGRSLTEVAKTAGISKSALSEIERDRTQPGIDTFAAVARAFGMPMDRLYRGWCLPALPEDPDHDPG